MRLKYRLIKATDGIQSTLLVWGILAEVAITAWTMCLILLFGISAFPYTARVIFVSFLFGIPVATGVTCLILQANLNRAVREFSERFAFDYEPSTALKRLVRIFPSEGEWWEHRLPNPQEKVDTRLRELAVRYVSSDLIR